MKFSSDTQATTLADKTDSGQEKYVVADFAELGSVKEIAEEPAVRGWRSKFVPKVEPEDGWGEFCVIGTKFARESGSLDVYVQGDKVDDACEPIIVSILDIAHELSKCPYGEEDVLKKISLTIRAQLQNAVIDRRHVEFVRMAAQFIDSQSQMNDLAVQEVRNIARKNGLDPNRGILAADATKKRFKIVEE
jgi:hypothetical protein